MLRLMLLVSLVLMLTGMSCSTQQVRQCQCQEADLQLCPHQLPKARVNTRAAVLQARHASEKQMADCAEKHDGLVACHRACEER